MNFLDVTLKRGYRTRCNDISVSQEYSALLATSCHPEHVVHNIPVGELACIKRNCRGEDTLLVQQNLVCARLRERKYPEWTLQRAKHRVAKMSRETLLKDEIAPSNQKSTDSLITFSTTYSMKYREVVKIVKKHFFIKRHHAFLLSMCLVWLYIFIFKKCYFNKKNNKDCVFI